MKRNDYLDNLKFILILLVVIAHFSMKLTYVAEIKYLMYYIYIFHMPSFIFINGYLAKNMNSGGKLRADKILTVFWMYLIFKIGNVLLSAAFGEPLKFQFFKDYSAPWYLLALCIWYLSVPLLERIKVRYLIPGSFLIGMAAGYINSIGNVMSLSRIFVFFPFFIIGFCLPEARYEAFLDKKQWKFPAVVLLTSIFVAIFLLWKHLRPFADIVYGSSPYKATLGDLAKYGLLVRGVWYLLAVLVSAAFMLLVPRGRLFFTGLGNRTMQVYMIHIWIRNALAYAGFFTFLKGQPDYLAALVLIACIPLTLLLSVKWLKKLYDFLMTPKLFGIFLKKA
jgi:fucose 4-O-acetylase-like acetyltransferase